MLVLKLLVLCARARNKLDAQRRDKRVDDVRERPRRESESHRVRAVLDFIFVAIKAALEAHIELAVGARVKELVHLLHPREKHAPDALLRHLADLLVDVEVASDLRCQRADARSFGHDEHRLHALKAFLHEDEVLMLEKERSFQRLRRDLDHCGGRQLERFGFEALLELRLGVDRLIHERDDLLRRAERVTASRDHDVALSSIALLGSCGC